MGIREILITVSGFFQGAIGVLSIIFAYILYFNTFDMQNRLAIPSESLTVYLFFLSIFAFLSIVSFLFLIHERLELERGII